MFFGQFEKTSPIRGQGKLKISGLGSTKMACPDVAINEQTFLNIFADTICYEIAAGSLILFNKDHDVLATFKAVYF